MKRLVVFATLVSIAVASAFTTPAVAEFIAVPAAPNPSEPGLRRAGELAKAGYRLARAHAELMAHRTSGRSDAFEPSDKSVGHHRGLVVVNASAAEDGDVLLTQLRGLGLQNGARYGNQVAGLFPLAKLRAALALDELRAIHAVPGPILNTGLVTSQGDLALQADIARLRDGIDGTGITVGVISDSYDASTFVDVTAAQDVASGDLPNDVQVLSESPLCGSGQVACIDEGRAMLQIVHDLAPGADLMFHTVLASTVDFALAIGNLVAAGADVVVDDVLYLNEPMFEDGIVAQAAEDAVAAGVPYFSAAGNQADSSYESAFDNSGEVFCIEVFLPYDDCDPLFERVGPMHDFDPGTEVALFQDITIPVGSSLSLMFQWDEPWGNVRNDHIIVLLSHDGASWITMSANDNRTTGEAWEVIQYVNYFGDFGGPTGDKFKIAITYDDVDSIVSPAALMKTVHFGSGTSIDTFANNRSTLIAHANAPNVAAVGAANWDDTPYNGISPPQLASYSSLGGTPILFGPGGNRLSTPEYRDQPRFVAADGVDTTFFFNDTNGDGFPEFFGTSAAAPHAAAVAALMLQSAPGATPQQLNGALAATAIDMGVLGPDPATGAGLIQADAAIDALGTSGGLPPSAGFMHSENGLTVTFLDASTDPDGSVVGWSWDFGDGGASNVQHPEYTYAADGTYPVTLTVWDDAGNSDAATQSVTVAAGGVNTSPEAAFSYNCASTSCTFDDLSTDSDGDAFTWLWNFGDGNVSTDQHPVHVYAAPGRYDVTLVIDDGTDTGSVTASFRLKNRGSTSGSTGGSSDNEVSSEKGRKKCADGLDNDNDGLIDGADPDCA